MTRREFVRRFVLNEIGDDYENLEHIAAIITREGNRCGLAISMEDIVHALVELIEAGLARAYKLDPFAPPIEIEGVPPLKDIGDYFFYFWATTKGMELHHSNDEWYPFQENGELRKDWVVPTQ